MGPIALRVPLSPNTVSAIALVLNALAAVLLAYAGRRPILFLVVPAVVTVAGLLDALDGLIARLQGKQSRFGDFIDHTFDRISDLLLTAGWVLGAGVRKEMGLLAVVLVALVGYCGTQLEATFGARNYSSTGRGEFVLAVVCLPLIAYSTAVTVGLDVRLAYLTIPEWLTLLLIVGSTLSVLQRYRMAARMSRGEQP